MTSRQKGVLIRMELILPETKYQHTVSPLPIPPNPQAPSPAHGEV